MSTAFLDEKSETAMEAAHQNHADSEDFWTTFQNKI